MAHKIKLTSQEINLLLLAVQNYKYLPVGKDLVAKLSNIGPKELVLTYNQWSGQGRQVMKGEKSTSRNEDGEAVFSIKQTMVIGYTVDEEYEELGEGIWSVK